jgi:hypothetical protein
MPLGQSQLVGPAIAILMCLYLNLMLQDGEYEDILVT